MPLSGQFNKVTKESEDFKRLSQRGGTAGGSGLYKGRKFKLSFDENNNLDITVETYQGHEYLAIVVIPEDANGKPTPLGCRVFRTETYAINEKDNKTIDAICGASMNDGQVIETIENLGQNATLFCHAETINMKSDSGTYFASEKKKLRVSQ